VQESNQQPQRCEENMNQVEMSAEVVVAGTAVPLKARCGLRCMRMRLHHLVCRYSYSPFFDIRSQ
jgi:hypothetical protein